MYTYRESVYQDGSAMYVMALECPVANSGWCGYHAGQMDTHFFYKDADGRAYTSRAARLYGAPDSVTLLSGQFYFLREGEMFAKVGTVVAFEGGLLEAQAKSLAKKITALLRKNAAMESGVEIEAFRVGTGPAIHGTAMNIVSAQMRIQNLWRTGLPQVQDLAYRNGYSQPPFMSALLYLERVSDGHGSGPGSDIDLLFFLDDLNHNEL
ncbi:MAG: hypothetical protein SGBAC_006531 [Bacillariaceae sp.]